MHEPKVGIFIINYKQPKLTLQCLASLSQVDYENYVIYLLDNESDGQLKKKVSNEYPHVKFFESKENLGFASGNNCLYEKSKNNELKYVLLLNNDTVVEAELLKELVKAFDDENVGIAGCIISYFDNPKKVWFGGGFLHPWFSFTMHIGKEKKVDNFVRSKSNVYKVDWVTGCCLMVDSTLLTGELFDAHYGSYFEDVDLCYWINKMDKKCVIVNKNLVKHKVSSSFGLSGSNVLTPARAYYYGRNPTLFVKKYYRGVKKLIALGGQLIPLGFFGFQMVIKGQFVSIGSYLHGMYDGMCFTKR